MKRIYILVEGQTEESFVSEAMVPFYAQLGIFIQPIIVSTSQSCRGGVTSYTKIKPQIENLCKQDRKAWVTTFFFFFFLPNNFPMKSSSGYNSLNNCHAKVNFLENALRQDISEQNFLPYIMLHEFEALLFVDPNKFKEWVDDESIIDSLHQIKASYSSPEEINNSPQTAPSKRILGLIPDYNKVIQGTIIAMEIGLDEMRRQCLHFNKWLDCLENLRDL